MSGQRGSATDASRSLVQCVNAGQPQTRHWEPGFFQEAREYQILSGFRSTTELPGLGWVTHA